MKTRFVLAWLALFRTVLDAAPPPITFTADPTEPLGGNVVYARVGAESEADGDSAKLWFAVTVTNNSGGSVTVTNIRATLNTGEVWDFTQKNVMINGGSAKTISLTEAQTITLPKPVPPVLTIGVYCDTSSDPRTLQRFLVAYTPETSDNRYIFPADEGDLGPDEYFSAGNVHLPPEGQRWGADWLVYRIDAAGTATSLREGTDGSLNEHYLGYGIPIRAVADGVVLRVNDGWMDSPVTDTRAFQQLETFDGEAISDVKVKYLGQLPSKERRFAVLVRRPDGKFTASIWDVASNGRDLIQRGAITSDYTVSDIAIEALSTTRFVVSVRLTGSNTHRLALYDVEDDTVGQPVFVNAIDGGSGYRELALARLSESAFASCVRDAGGNLRVEVCTVTSDTLAFGVPQTAEAASSVCATSLGGIAGGALRFVTSLRDSGGSLKVIVWDWPNPGSLDRRDDALGTSISRVAATSNAGGKWITAARTSSGFLQLARWSAAANGTILAPEMVTTTTHTIDNTALAVVHGTGNSGGQVNASTASVIAGNLKINGWGDHSDKGATTFGADSQSTEATFPVTHLSIDEGANMVYLVGARTGAGNLKLTTWFWAQGGGNFLIIRHGKCRVSYNHLKTGSVIEAGLKAGDVVAAGQFIGRQGNSGSAGTPHTHVHADRLADDYADGNADAALIDLENEFNYTGDGSLIPTLTARPIPFSDARAMKLADIVRGGDVAGVNDFATMTSHGIFDVALGIRPRLNTRYLDHLATGQNPTGRKEVVPPASGGPYHSTVAQAAGAAPAGSSLYIRGGNYNEAVTLNKRMTLRRYDYYSRTPFTEGSVVIGK